MLFLDGTTDKLDLVTSAAATIDVHVSAVDAVKAGLTAPAAVRQNTAITTATTTDVLATPAASATRTVKFMSIRNKHATLACDVTLRINVSATPYEIWKQTLRAGEALVFTEMLGFYVVPLSRLDRWMYVSGADYVNATTSFTDITGLQCPVLNGKRYNFHAMLIHANDATTTGSRFGINGPTLSAIMLATIDTVTVSVTAAALSAGAVTAVDTAATAQTTGATANRLGILTGAFTAGADGTFSMRGASEIAVAAGLTVRLGSWLHVWEPTG